MGQQNQVTPFGSLTYNQTGTQSFGPGGEWKVPTFSVTQTMSPTEQAKYGAWNNLFQQSAQRAQNQGAAPTLDLSNLYNLPTSQDQLRSDAYNALTARSTSDLNLASTQKETQLANQGIYAGTPAFDREMDQFNRARVDASTQATINAGTIAQQNLEQALGVRQQQVGERMDAYNAAMAGYQLPWQQLFGLGQSSGVTQPTYAQPNYTPIQPVDLASNVYAGYNAMANTYNTGYQMAAQQAMEQQRQAQAGSQEMLGGLFGLGSAGLGAAGRAGGFGKLFSFL
jgi:hypothetical protein